MDDEYVRPRERTDSGIAPRDVEAYRNSRPSVQYPSDPRHSTAAVDYGDEGYQYTNPSELVRYDLDHSKPARTRRRESMDRTYHRPNVQYDSGQRSLNVHSSADHNRSYSSNTARLYEGRGGPPPSTRGFEKLKALPAAPPPPASTPAAHAELSGTADWRDGKRSRPVSLYQDASAPRSSHHDDFYSSREDERAMRELRDREPKRLLNQPHYRDEEVMSRGFGIRTGENFDDGRDRRRDSWRDESRPRIEAREEPRKRSDEDLNRLREERRRSKLDDKEDRRPRRESRRGGSDEERDRSRLRDKLASGVGIAAAAVGLVPYKDKEKDRDDERRERFDKEPRKRRSPSEDRVRRDELDSYVRPKASGKDGDRERYADREKDRDYDRDYDRDHDRESTRRDKDDAERKERHRKDAGSKLEAGPPGSTSDSDEGKKSIRRSRSSAAFDPNDTSDLKSLKDQLASIDVNENGEEPAKKPADAEKERTRSNSPTAELITPDSQDESRGRELSIVSSENSHTKTVRVVSPPREKKEQKPIRGILKQPSAKFPEESNPIREGVAPHRDDKKAKDVPQGAKWTKISRKVVNPEALTIGKERFEVRDDFVIVLRVLDKEEIQAYAAATKVLRGTSFLTNTSAIQTTNSDIERRRARQNEDDQGDGQDDDHRRERRHQQDYSASEDEEYSHDRRDGDRRDGDRHRRHRREEEEDHDRHYSHHHSHRDRDRAIEA